VFIILVHVFVAFGNRRELVIAFCLLELASLPFI